MPNPLHRAKDPERKRAAGTCGTFRCTNRAARSANGNFKGHCPTCRSALYRLSHPLQYHFNLLRCGANRRKIAFALTFEEYRRFCDETGYHEKRGKQPSSLSIDRKDSKLGYCWDNIQVLTLAENCAKQDKSWVQRYFGGTGWAKYGQRVTSTCCAADEGYPQEEEGAAHYSEEELGFVGAETNPAEPF